ncbi:MAG: hypothetical protein SGI83_10260 [Bacteroidota bacterium]|nr:hypothetical protein [Bacteroidota bacterium]
MQQFEITLRNDKIKFYDRFAILIFGLNAVGIVGALLYTTDDININGKLFLQSLPVMLTAFPVLLLIQKKVSQYFIPFLVVSLVIVAYWIFIGYWWIALFASLLILLYVVAKKELIVNFISDRIVYPSFPPKRIEWSDLNNVVLKDRLLTIDFKNNKLIQEDIDAKSYSLNEEEFNDFCRQQLKK